MPLLGDEVLASGRRCLQTLSRHPMSLESALCVCVCEMPFLSTSACISPPCIVLHSYGLLHPSLRSRHGLSPECRRGGALLPGAHSHRPSNSESASPGGEGPRDRILSNLLRNISSESGHGAVHTRKQALSDARARGCGLPKPAGARGQRCAAGGEARRLHAMCTRVTQPIRTAC